MTTFFAMVYILMVNADMVSNPNGDGSNPLGVTYGAIYIATGISAVLGTGLYDLGADALYLQHFLRYCLWFDFLYRHQRFLRRH